MLVKFQLHRPKIVHRDRLDQNLQGKRSLVFACTRVQMSTWESGRGVCGKAMSGMSKFLYLGSERKHGNKKKIDRCYHWKDKAHSEGIHYDAGK